MSDEKFGELEEPIRKVKERIITFRVDEKTFLSIESLAEVRSKKPNEWARELVESEAAKEVPMTAGERLLFEEMARLRFIVGNALKLMAMGDLSSEGWGQVLAEAENQSEKIAQQLLAKRKSLGARHLPRAGKGANA
jgi:hypothetical protein